MVVMAKWDPYGILSFMWLKDIYTYEKALQQPISAVEPPAGRVDSNKLFESACKE
jgi:hypothetical protein